MSDADRWITEDDLDQCGILDRGFHNCGNEDYELVRCPHCQHIFLTDGEAEGQWDDPQKPGDVKDLLRDTCGSCSGELSRPMCGPDAPDGYRLTRRMAIDAGWGWALKAKD